MDDAAPKGRAEAGEPARAPAAGGVRAVEPTATPRSTRALAWGFALLTAVTGVLIVWGALVRAHGAGLACPDWPLCFGRFIPRFDLKVAYEWGHRVLASGVSLGLLGLSVRILSVAPLRARLLRPLVVAWLLLGMQVLLGALTVWHLLAPWTVTSHLIVGITFCGSLLWLSRELFEWDRSPAGPVPPVGARRAVVCVAVLLAAQLVLGGLVSSRGAGLACSAFPTCDGASLVPTLQGLVGLQVLHRLNGVAVLVAFAGFAWASRANPGLQRLAVMGLRLTLLQIGVGVLNVLLQLKVEVTALHTACAAGLALIVCLSLRAAFRGAGHARAERAAAGSAWPGVQPV